MPQRKLALLLIAAGLAVAPRAAVAAEVAGAAIGFRATQAAVFLAEGAPVLAPLAHVLYCRSASCSPNGSRSIASLTEERLQQLAKVNREINRAIEPRIDPKGFANDRWSLAPGAGDCEDFALTKQDRLVRLGWPAGALRMAVGRTGAGEGHAVLVVRTEAGDLVLDNRTDRILSPRQTDITFVKIQSGEDPRRWRALADG